MTASDRNEVQMAYDAFGKGAGMTKHSGSWYRSTSDLVTVVNLQKSQYGSSYYLNVGWWLQALGTVKFPKENELHVRTRLEALVPDRTAEIAGLLNLERPVADRTDRLRDMLHAELLPILNSTQTVEGLRVLRRLGKLNDAAIRRAAVAIIDK